MNPLSSSPVDASYLEPTFRRTLRIWWAWLWRVGIWAFGLNFVFGFILGLAGIWGELQPVERFYFSFLFGSVVSLAIQPLILRRVLRKDFREFRIRLVSEPPKQ